MSGTEETAGQAEPTASEVLRHGSVISSRPLPLDIERPDPWNKWWHKAVHYWRYGYSHPDEDLLGVIDAVGDALHVQVITAKAVLPEEQAAKAEQIHQALDRELKKRRPDFSILLAIESQINALYPPAMERRRQWVIRDRFARVAPPEAFQKWQLAQAQQSGADAAADGGDEARPLSEADADTQTLLDYIHTNYLMTIGREKAVRDLKRWLLMRFWAFLLFLVPTLFLVWMLLWLNDMGQYWGLLLGLFLIATVGRAGATTSVIRRLQSAISDNVLAADPIIELTALRTGKNEISMALLSSSIFALLMWAFFASGVPRLVGFEGGIFPRAAAAPQETAPAAVPAPAPAPTEPKDEDEAGVVPPAEDAQANETSPAPAPGAADAPPAEAEPAPPAAETAEPEPAPSIRPDLPAAAQAALARAEAEVSRQERAYQLAMARLADAGGMFEGNQRARYRAEARVAIEGAQLVQQELVGFFEIGLQRARNAGDAATAVRWTTDLTETATRHDRLREMRTAIHSAASEKVPPSVACPTGEQCNPFRPLADALRLADESDFFKMLLWAFIAGFAERFVPDMLDRVVVRSRGDAGAAAASPDPAPPRPAPGPPPPPPPPPGRNVPAVGGHPSGP